MQRDPAFALLADQLTEEAARRLDCVVVMLTYSHGQMSCGMAGTQLQPAFPVDLPALLEATAMALRRHDLEDRPPEETQ